MLYKWLTETFLSILNSIDRGFQMAFDGKDITIRVTLDLGEIRHTILIPKTEIDSVESVRVEFDGEIYEFKETLNINKEVSKIPEGFVAYNNQELSFPEGVKVEYYIDNQSDNQMSTAYKVTEVPPMTLEEAALCKGYYYVSSSGCIEYRMWRGGGFDFALVNYKNCFRTKRIARIALDWKLLPKELMEAIEKNRGE